ncbi:hypothetical protein [Legionella hackeliae]|nr:hypothetical protein [Legionella hackeliae]
MKFSGKFENQYNEFWNNVVVLAYKQIKAYAKISAKPSFFSGHNYTVDLNHWVNKYCDGALSLLNNLSRQLPLFDDKDNAALYLEQTKAAVVGDLTKFKTFLHKQSIAVARIEQTLSIVNPVVVSDTEMNEVGAEFTEEVTPQETIPSTFVTIEKDWNEFMKGVEEKYPSLLDMLMTPPTNTSSSQTSFDDSMTFGFN